MGDFSEQRITKDELTGLLDKQTFYKCAQDLLNDDNSNYEYTFIFFDLDNFKVFNANYGYELGDELLISLGYIVQDVFENQLVSRFSGDHFVVLANSTQIIPAIKSIRQRVKLLQRSINIELKAGIYVVEGGDKNVIRCCDRARMACISIKKKYDMAYRFYDDALGGSLKKKQEILDSLQEAIEKKYIKVYYQPIVRAMTGQVCSWEALVRWIDPKKGMIFPNEFIPVLEEYRLIPQIDAFVMEEVFYKYRNFVSDKMSAVPVSINLSRIDFETMDIVKFLDDRMAKYNCPKDMFHFEITESALMDSPHYIMEQVKILREKGYKIWMDDFGSGYSSLNVLKNYNFDLIKIDMDFLSDFENNDQGKIILKHIVSMIKNLNMHTLVEGVETQEQYDFLKSIGCELIQGYLIGRPMPYLEGVECIKKDGRQLETKFDRLFYSEIASIDILKQNPLHNIDQTILENPLPLAIYVRDNKVWKTEYTNSGFKNLMLNLGGSDVGALERMLNADENIRGVSRNQFFEVCQNSKEEHKTESMDFIENGRVINLRVRHICSDELNDRDAYLVSIRLLSRLIDEKYDTRLNAISRAIFAQYECVDLYGIHDSYFENVYLNDSSGHVDYRNKSPRQIISEVSMTQVHPDDRMFFDTFMNLDTAEERISEEPTGVSVGFFRLRDAKRNYVWKEVMLSIMRLEHSEVLLCCVSEACNEISRQMNMAQSSQWLQGEQGHIQKITDKPELANIIQLLPVGIFWKDKERRFLGANQMFLEYYGLQSVEQIIGKTDEDMGWHINPEPFKQDELSVINEGKIISNVEGECIVKGKVRKIMASKCPYMVDRKIVGLVGCFKDITVEIEEIAKLEKLSVTDALTDQYNRRGFGEIVKRYLSQYQQDKTDFSIIMIDIDKFKQINDMYGHDYGDEILKKTSKVLKHVASDNSVVFRYGGDEFLILHQHKNIAEIESIKQEINMGLTRYEKMTSTLIPVRASIGYAIYSDYEDLSRCIDEADKNMYMDKEKHKKEKK